MSDPYPYQADQEIPSIPLEAKDRDGNLYDFSTGWTFTAKFCLEGTLVIAHTKSTGIVGAATSPNLIVSPAVADWAALAPSALGTVYDVYVYCRRTADSLDYVYRPVPQVRLYTAPAAA
jgi:hypothetical protein